MPGYWQNAFHNISIKTQCLYTRHGGAWNFPRNRRTNRKRPKNDSSSYLLEKKKKPPVHLSAWTHLIRRHVETTLGPADMRARCPSITSYHIFYVVREHYRITVHRNHVPVYGYKNIILTAGGAGKHESSGRPHPPLTILSQSYSAHPPSKKKKKVWLMRKFLYANVHMLNIYR